MCQFKEPKKLTFEKQMGLSPKQQIKPLFSRKVERLKNLRFWYNEVRVFQAVRPGSSDKTRVLESKEG